MRYYLFLGIRNARAAMVTNALPLLLCSALVAPGHAATHFQRLKSFGNPEYSASQPQSPLLEGSDGKLYGAAYSGGMHHAGSVFRLEKDGSAFQVLHHFLSEETDGFRPMGGLIEGSDGVLYGTAAWGGAPGSMTAGIVFKLNHDGSGYQILHRFGDGLGPQGRLIESRDGALYGMTAWGGRHNKGVLFRMNKDGSQYSVLHHFGETGADGQFPDTGLAEGIDGALYGLTARGGGADQGVLFKLGQDGGYRILRSFGETASDGARPSSLVTGIDGMLYGTTHSGGAFDRGTVFRLDQDGGAYAILHSFASNWGHPLSQQAGLIEGTDGTLYGTTAYGGNHNLGQAFKLEKDGGGYVLLHSFSSANLGGFRPLPHLAEGTDGALYGMTGGAVFKLARDGRQFDLLAPLSREGGDGTSPHAALIEGRDGTLYGATWHGGRNGLGVVFQVNRDGGGYSVLHDFDYRGNTHFPPTLMEGSDSTLYGSISGGTHEKGALFSLGKDGTYRLLHSFSGRNLDGEQPGRLLETRSGLLVGTTRWTVFSLNKDGSGFALLHRFMFTGHSSSLSQARLLEGSDEVLYGATATGGNSNFGAIFKLNQDGSGYRILHHFGSISGDARYPHAGLLEDPDGALYGTAIRGGIQGHGAVFKLHKDGGGYALLHSFKGESDGRAPQGKLVIGSDRALYGTTTGQGHGENPGDGGTIFRLDTDGSGYRVLHRFPSSGLSGGRPYAGLLAAGDGFLYGTTSLGGEMGLGSIFRLAIAPIILRLEPFPMGTSLMVSGIPGRNYEIQAAAELNASSWTGIGVAVAGSDGRLHFLDPTVPRRPARFYRAVTLRD